MAPATTSIENPPFLFDSVHQVKAPRLLKALVRRVSSMVLTTLPPCSAVEPAKEPTRSREGRSMSAGYPKGRRRRAEIVEAAFAKFASVGYRNASMVQIAADCGVSRMGLAHHFPTKEALLAAVLEERDRVNGELFFAGFDATADGLDYFSRLARVVEYNATVPELVRLYAMLSVEAADPAHPAHAYFVNRYTNIRRDIRDALGELHARGLVRPGVSIAGAESDLMALLDGLQVQWLLDPASVDMGTRFRRRLSEMFLVEVP
ncbi:TetR/AcrR family transcriptional regulator [Nonomuraea angiospora]|uniref:TetR/AcrR family transcriptional regulator n=1 Tax=Nonomuraea angiospora TaxID=46172 RepID=UPI00344B06AB